MDIKIKSSDLQIQRGFSLIELMIAIPIGLLVLFAVLKIFTVNIQGVNMQNAFARVQENGRMATELISRDIRGVDYWGCVNDSSLIINNLAAPGAVDLVLTNGAVEGENNVAVATFSFNRTNTDGTVDAIFAQTGSDILTLRGAQSYAGVAITAMVAFDSGVVTLSDGTGIENGAAFLISDCENGDIFSNTSASGALGYAGSLSSDYDTDAQILSPTSKTYFIAASESNNAVSSLYRRVNGIASEMVRGIKDLQVTYGEDRDGNGSVEVYSDASAVSDMGNVLAIRVELVSESGNGVSGTALERTYTITGNVRNRTLQ